MRRPTLVLLLGVCASACGLVFPFDPRPSEPAGPCAAIVCPPQTECALGSCIARGPCEGIACEAPLVCSGGSCVNRLLDEDGDGFSVEADCDDSDPLVVPGSIEDCTTTCGKGTTTCRDGSWSTCSAPTDCSCTPGTERTEPCGGTCGFAVRKCLDEGRWAAEPGPCETVANDACSPGAVQVEDCDESCTRRTRTCGPDCNWGEYGGCEGIAECAAGATEVGACGLCGTQTRTCADGCLWSTYGACSGEGACSPGTTEDQACGDCGTQRRTCGPDCSWGSWGGCNAGACAPGAVETQACGLCGSQSRACAADCNWYAWSVCSGQGSCAPGQAQVQPCGNCGAQTRTCTAACAWPDWPACAGEGACAPGTFQTVACNQCGDQTQLCNATCSWANSGSCVGGSSTLCDDSYECTSDVCSGNGSCTYSPDGCGQGICCDGVCQECCGGDISTCGVENPCLDWICNAGNCEFINELGGTDPEHECGGNFCCDGAGQCGVTSDPTCL